MRMIASSIVVLSGGVCLGLGVQAQGSMSYGARDIGVGIIFVGGIAFVVDYLRALKRELQAERENRS